MTLRDYVTLYAVPTSGCYHRAPHCPGLGPAVRVGWTAYPVAHDVVQRSGLRPCRTCTPPAVLTVVDLPLEGTG